MSTENKKQMPINNAKIYEIISQQKEEKQKGAIKSILQFKKDIQEQETIRDQKFLKISNIDKKIKQVKEKTKECQIKS